MKKIILLLTLTILLSGCSVSLNNMDNISIYTTVYPLEYLSTMLYGNNSTINSIYPNEIVELSNKLIEDYSKKDLFVYNGLSEEKNYAVDMLNYNKHLMIVDAAMGMEFTYGEEELWINPSNFLMLSQNIKNGMKEYITTTYLKNMIEKNYNNLKIEISEIDAEIKLIVEMSDKSNILIGNDSLLFLEKYGLNIYSLDNDTITNKKISDAETAITQNSIKYIYLFENDILSEEVENILNKKKIKKIYIHTITLLSEEQKNNGENYITMMQKNIDLLKKELYE
ncbi:MAG: metal ABC transporter substrate-binding protein [Bacilli bacterium]|nr:metal ABC transporter substrate-binding protein [Bacilli bacterium]